MYEEYFIYQILQNDIYHNGTGTFLLQFLVHYDEADVLFLYLLVKQHNTLFILSNNKLLI